MSVSGDGQVLAAIERLYRTFGAYPIVDLGPCAHCSDYDQNMQIARRLKTVPLREATVDDLDVYGVSAGMTWGRAEDLKHFLPRFLELLVSDLVTFETLTWAWFGSVLEYSGVRAWPGTERSAVQAFFAATWAAVLAAPSTAWDLGDLLEAIALVDDDLTPYLQIWSAALARNDPAASDHLVELASSVQGDAVPRWHWGAQRRDQARAVRDWMNRDDIRQRLPWAPA